MATDAKSELMSFEDGKGPQVKECMQSLEAGKGKEMGSFLVSRKNAALLIP